MPVGRTRSTCAPGSQAGSGSLHAELSCRDTTPSASHRSCRTATFSVAPVSFMLVSPSVNNVNSPSNILITSITCQCAQTKQPGVAPPCNWKQS
ncbi:Uncharacterised protein [Mycobacteroides abscessus subsp. abscessus]|nr:Uncharacterised protein [Mycobacteroides abscessus subsp. abscessus]